MPDNIVYAGDDENIILISCGEDISEATAQSIKVKKPDKTTAVWDAEIYGTTQLKHTIDPAADLDGGYGNYILVPYFEFSTSKVHGEPVTLVYERLYDV